MNSPGIALRPPRREILLTENMTRIARFRDRKEAGQLLAKELSKYANCQDLLILALPRGGVPVGFEVAKALNAPQLFRRLQALHRFIEQLQEGLELDT